MLETYIMFLATALNNLHNQCSLVSEKIIVRTYVQGPAAAMVHSKVRYVLSSYLIPRIVLTNGTKII